MLYPLSYEGGDLSENASETRCERCWTSGLLPTGCGGQAGEVWATADSVAGRVRSASVFDHRLLDRADRGTWRTPARLTGRVG